MKYYTRHALRTTTVMVGLPFRLVLLHRERKSLVRIGGACFLGFLFVAFAAFPGFGQQSPDPKVQVASASTPAAQSVADEIRKLAALRSEGVLTEEEFAAAKERLIGG